MNKDKLMDILRSNSTRDAEIILTKMVCWQPMETAPKDGTEILVWAHMFNPIYKTIADVQGRYVVSWRETWTSGGTNAKHIEAWCVSGTWDANDDVWDRVYPTHWMPLPERP